VWRLRAGRGAHWISHAPPALVERRWVSTTTATSTASSSSSSPPPTVTTTSGRWVVLRNDPLSLVGGDVSSSSPSSRHSRPPSPSSLPRLAVDVCFRQPSMLREGLGFTHYAYALASQVQFKEHFYGYEGALAQWLRMQSLSSNSDSNSSNSSNSNCTAAATAAAVPATAAASAATLSNGVEVHDFLQWVPAGTRARAVSDRAYLGKSSESDAPS
jgi:hypothetical protein